MNSRERVINTINQQKTDRLPLIPITMSLAADEINIPYLDYATNYKYHIAGQLAISDKYSFDHVSAISDPATEVADCGGKVVFMKNEPPGLDEEDSLLAEKKDLVHLQVPKPEMGKRMSNRLEVISGLESQIGNEKIIEGWIEGPTAESCDLRGINRFMIDIYDSPDFVEDLLNFVFEMGMGFAEAQIKAGADIIGVGDAAASLLSPELYEKYILKYHTKYVKRIHELGAYARLHICGNINHLLPLMGNLNVDIVDLDSLTSVSIARKYLGDKTILAGNIDPVATLKDGTPRLIEKKLYQCYIDAGKMSYAVNAGCEIPRGTPEENIYALRDFAKNC